jgi:uncharacterized protein with HEPN domain
LIHGYFDVDADIVRKTATTEPPETTGRKLRLLRENHIQRSSPSET